MYKYVKKIIANACNVRPFTTFVADKVRTSEHRGGVVFCLGSSSKKRHDRQVVESKGQKRVRRESYLFLARRRNFTGIFGVLAVFIPVQW